jgi:hypothetical protein
MMIAAAKVINIGHEHRVGPAGLRRSYEGRPCVRAGPNKKTRRRCQQLSWGRLGFTGQTEVSSSMGTPRLSHSTPNIRRVLP